MKNPTLFDSGLEDDPGQLKIFDLFDRHEKEIVYFLEREYGFLTPDEKLAVMLVSCFVRAGHVCMPIDRTADQLARIIDLDEAIAGRIKKTKLDLTNSSIIGGQEGNTPLVKENNLLYFRRYFRDEQNLKQWIKSKGENEEHYRPSSSFRAILDELFAAGAEQVNWQKAAAALSVFKQFLIVSGGPGTGKTTTVARMLTLQQRLHENPLKIALAAPTGKAAGRMGEALFNELEKLGLTAEELSGFPEEAQTIHRLLSEVEEHGLLPPAKKKLLAYDLVIVDEASMIDLSLMNRLIEHLSEDTKLFLLGDKDQLASVEAGSVFADLCRKKENIFTTGTAARLSDLGLEVPKVDDSVSGTEDAIIYLTKSFRFDEMSGIGQLAGVVKKGISGEDELLQLFAAYDDIDHHSFGYKSSDFNQMIAELREKIIKTAFIKSPEEMLKFWKSSIWLTIMRQGLSGSDRLNKLAEQSLAASRLVNMNHGWYHGRPVMVTRNNYDLGIFNGDHGVCIKHENNDLLVHIQSGAGIKKIQPDRLLHFSPAYFLTVHKSQGSEFRNVNLLMPAKDTSLLSKELLYTAITRAKKTLHLYGSIALFAKGSRRSTERFSGFN